MSASDDLAAALEAAATASQRLTWRLDQSVKDTTTKRQKEALSRLDHYQVRDEAWLASRHLLPLHVMLWLLRCP